MKTNPMIEFNAILATIFTLIHGKTVRNVKHAVAAFQDAIWYAPNPKQTDTMNTQALTVPEHVDSTPVFFWTYQDHEDVLDSNPTLSIDEYLETMEQYLDNFSMAQLENFFYAEPEDLN